jgi:DNA-binding transcriptional LysR family regulator
LRQFQHLRLEIHMLTAAEILRRVAEFQLDLGVSFLNVERAEEFHTIPLFEERYMLVARDNQFATRESVSWAELPPENSPRRVSCTRRPWSSELVLSIGS